MDFDYILAFISSTITGVSSYLIGSKRAKKENDNLTLQNIEKSITIYQTIVDDLRGEIVKLNKKVIELEKKIDELMDENMSLKQMLESKSRKTKQSV
jgi:peptidoglycan hydrolase CwlO-like protein